MAICISCRKKCQKPKNDIIMLSPSIELKGLVLSVCYRCKQRMKPKIKEILDKNPVWKTNNE